MHAAAVGSGIGLVLTNSSLELKTMRIRSADPELVCKDPHLGLRHHWSLEAGSVQRAVELRTFSFVVFPPVTLTETVPNSERDEFILYLSTINTSCKLQQRP